MSKFQILCTTMHQKDFSKIQEMNVRSDVIFANQADRTEKAVLEFEGHRAVMVTTDTRGVGINRNVALMHATGDVLLFSDDDIVYADDCAEQTHKAFQDLPEADVIVFEIDYEKNGEVYLKSRHRTGRLPLWKSLKYGAARIAVRRSSIEKANIWFHTQFGGGCKYSAGEDSLFLLDCYRKGLKVYTYSYCLGKTEKNESTWFEGYNEKYFRDKGAWLVCAMPRLCWLAVLPLAFKWRGLNKEMGLLQIIKYMYAGARMFKKS